MPKVVEFVEKRLCKVTVAFSQEDFDECLREVHSRFPITFAQVVYERYCLGRMQSRRARAAFSDRQGKAVRG